MKTVNICNPCQTSKMEPFAKIVNPNQPIKLCMSVILRKIFQKIPKQ